MDGKVHRPVSPLKGLDKNRKLQYKNLQVTTCRFFCAYFYHVYPYHLMKEWYICGRTDKVNSL